MGIKPPKALALAIHVCIPLLNTIPIVMGMLVLLFPVPFPDFAMLSIAPSLRWMNVSLSNQTEEELIQVGPTVWLGILGSCARINGSMPLGCTARTFFPDYNVSLELLAEASPPLPLHLFQTPTIGFPYWITVAIILVGSCTGFTTLIHARRFWLRVAESEVVVEKSFLTKFLDLVIVRWIMFMTGLLSVGFVLTAFVRVHGWYSKTCDLFNAVIRENNGPAFNASLHNVFLDAIYGCIVVFIDACSMFWEWRRVSMKQQEIKLQDPLTWEKESKRLEPLTFKEMRRRFKRRRTEGGEQEEEGGVQEGSVQEGSEDGIVTKIQDFILMCFL